jgi:spore germination protein YaaH
MRASLPDRGRDSGDNRSMSPRPRPRRPVPVAALAAVTAVTLAGTVLATEPARASEHARPDGPTRYVTGWLPYWTTAASVASYLAHARVFTEVSPFWHSTRWDAGTRRTTVVSYVSSGTRSSTLARLRTAGRPIVPSVTDGTPAGRMSKVLRDPRSRATHVRQLVSLVRANGYDGIDLDYEGFAFRDGRGSWERTRPAWVAFVRQLSRALHRDGRLLTMAIPPMCDSDGDCGERTGYWVYASEEVTPYVDRIRIMTYDYSWDVPGPISPDPWARAVAAHAAATLRTGTVQIGAPTYGYDWARLDRGDVDGDGDTGERLLTGDCPAHGRGAPAAERRAYRAMTERDHVSGRGVGGLRAAHGSPRVRWDARAKESWFRYRDSVRWTDGRGRAHRCVVHREVWFADARSMAVRSRFVGDYGIRGLAMWDIGYEDPRQWSRMRPHGRDRG